jgi:hypothetical protein
MSQRPSPVQLWIRPSILHDDIIHLQKTTLENDEWISKIMDDSHIIHDRPMVHPHLYLSRILGTTSSRVYHFAPSLKTARYGLGPKPGTNRLWIISSCIHNLNLPSLSSLDLSYHLPPFLTLLLILQYTPIHLLQCIMHAIELQWRHNINDTVATIRFRWAKHLRTHSRVPIIICQFIFLSFIHHLKLHSTLIAIKFLLHQYSMYEIPLHLNLLYQLIFEPFYLLNPTHHGSQVRLLLRIILLLIIEHIWHLLRYDSIFFICTCFDLETGGLTNRCSPLTHLMPLSTATILAGNKISVDPMGLPGASPFRLFSERQPSILQALNAHRTDFDPGLVAKLFAVFDDHDHIFKVILDTGASVSITPHREDFVTYHVTTDSRSIQTVNGTTAIVGVGIVRWVFLREDGTEVELLIHCNHVPKSEVRLLSPQHYCSYHGFDRVNNQYGGNGSYFWMNTNNDSDRFSCPIEPRSNLPVALSKRACRDGSCPPKCHAGSEAVRRQVAIKQAVPSTSCHSCGSHKHCPSSSACTIIPDSCSHHGMAHISVADQTNQNLTPAKRALLLWHWRLGHIGFDHLQRLFIRPDDKNEKHGRCLSSNVPGIHTTPSPMCAACALARAKLKGAGVTHTIRPGKSQLLKRGHLQPGQCISVDHYESAVKGHLPHTKGRESYGNKYVGGTIFADHASRYVSCHHQVSLAAPDTVVSKRLFERMAKECGVKVEQYHGDNGHFKANEFKEELAKCDQPLTLSGVGAHFQNGVAERAIRTVTEKARAMMHHASLHWPEQFQIELWPFALDYACWLHNHTPDCDSGFAPIEIFASTSNAGDNLQRARVWGSPGYVLSPKIQDGHKVPKWAVSSSVSHPFIPPQYLSCAISIPNSSALNSMCASTSFSLQPTPSMTIQTSTPGSISFFITETSTALLMMRKMISFTFQILTLVGYLLSNNHQSLQ